ncbi:MAG: hypothetical protein HY801_07010 [Candidatus Lindowbacteria bacterium]|nr:hypothetical protein [Candidatus Lindowbacteria bacterium]
MKPSAIMLLITGIANTLFYIKIAMAGYPLHPNHPAAYRDLQQAATWADGWMGLMAIVGGIGILLGWDWGRLAGIAAAAALIHMGFLDVAFHLQHAMYKSLDPMMLVMIVVDLWAFGAGTVMLVLLWRGR